MKNRVDLGALLVDPSSCLSQEGTRNAEHTGVIAKLMFKVAVRGKNLTRNTSCDLYLLLSPTESCYT